MSPMKNKIRRPRWGRDHRVRFINAIKPFPKDTPGKELYRAVRKEFTVAERSDSSLSTRMYRLHNAGNGKCYYSDCKGDQTKANSKYLPIRAELHEFGLIKTHITNIRIIPKSDRKFTTKQRRVPSGKVRMPFGVTMDWREDDTKAAIGYLNDTPKKTVFVEYNVALEMRGKKPVKFKTVRRYINGFIKHNSGYSNGGSKDFVKFVSIRSRYNYAE